MAHGFIKSVLFESPKLISIMLIIGGVIGAAIGAWRGSNRHAAAPDAMIDVTPRKPKPRNQDTVAELIRFGELRDKGLITQAEFDAQKARLLGEGADHGDGHRDHHRDPRGTGQGIAVVRTNR